MAFDHKQVGETDDFAVAMRDLWRRRNRVAMWAVDDWIEALGLPDTKPLGMDGRWLAQSNWPGDKLLYRDPADELAAIAERREPAIKIAPSETGQVLIECGEIMCDVMERHSIKAMDLIAYAKGYMTNGKPNYPLAWEWLGQTVDLTGYGVSLEMIMPQKPKFTRASSLAGADIPPREWLVDGLLPNQTVTLLTGDGGTGKSLLALQLSVAIACGEAWLGRSTEIGSVVFLSAEDDMDELHRRLADIVAGMGIGLDDLHDLHIRSTVGNGALLADKGRSGFVPSALFAEIEQAAADHYARLVVLDTLANFFPGDENDRAQTTQFVDILKGLAVRCGCTVLLLAHPSKSSMETGAGYSGNTAWNNAVRSRLYLQRVAKDGYEADPDARTLRTMKANYGRVGGEIALKWCDGVFAAVAPETGLDRASNSAKAERVFIALLRLHNEIGIRVSHSGGRNYAPNLFADHPASEGCNRRVLKTAMASLLARGTIKIAEEGPPSKRRTFLIEGMEE